MNRRARPPLVRSPRYIECGARTIIILFALLLGLGSCAQKGFPPGGPPDVTPPHVVSARPDSGASRVDLTAAISITFDDKMDRRSVESAFHVTPPTDMGSLKWDGKALTVTPARGLEEGRTYTLLIGGGVRDRRGNRAPGPVVVHFSTGDSVAPGLVTGRVETGRAKARGVLVWAYDSDDCPPVLRQSPAVGVGEADTKGEFAIGGLETTRTHCVYAHLDVDFDGELDEGELFVGADSLVTFGPDSSVVSGVTIYLVPDDEPGAITGTVADSTGPAPSDSALIGAWPGVAPALSDSVAAPAAVDTLALMRAWADSVYRAAKIVVVAVEAADSSNFAQSEASRDGRFTLKRLRPGVYRLEAFRDLNGDKSADVALEPRAIKETATVRAGRKEDVGVMVLRRGKSEAAGR